MGTSAPELVAQFLRASGYTETLAAFIREAGLPPDTGANLSDGITLEQVLREKAAFDLSQGFEKLGVEDRDKGWLVPSPSKPECVPGLTSSNFLSVHMMDLMLPGNSNPRPCVAATTADRRLELLDASSSALAPLQSYTHIQDSPILDLISFGGRFVLTAAMSGKLVLYDAGSDRILDERKDHAKYVVKLAKWTSGSTVYIATAGWDAKVFVYRIHVQEGCDPKLEAPIATLASIPSIPETVVFIQGQGHILPVLLLTRRDSSYLYYYALPPLDTEPSELALLGRQNLAPHSIAWVALTPCDVQICPTDSSLAAIATSSIPHMKLLIARLLVPPPLPPQSNTNSSPPTSEPHPAPTDILSQNRAALALQDREEVALLISTSTFAAQTPYSTPKLAWRPDGSGVFVNADDGVIRGFEARTGKLVASLTGHVAGAKVRCLWAGRGGRGEGAEEWLVSGGFDQRLVVWTC